MEKTIRYFKFSDGSVAPFPIDYIFLGCKPTHIYSSNMLGFGKWKLIK